MGNRKVLFCLVVMVMSFLVATAVATSEVILFNAQTVYVPIYSHVYYGDRAKSINLSATLCLRNTDSRYSITILSAKYVNSKGSLIKEYVKRPITLSPLASTHMYVKESDITGGFGANFIVKWRSGNSVNEPIIESVMIGASGGQGISFVCRGKEIKEMN